jgi:hypothetical protein
MSKDKKSFFERLTGAVAVEDEMEEQEEQLPSRTLSLAKSGKEGRGSKRSVNTRRCVQNLDRTVTTIRVFHVHRIPVSTAMG